jgi:hypothetical protein
MADPISVRHVMATVNATERVAKAQATQQHAFDDQFAKEMSKQEAEKHTRIARKEAENEIRDKEDTDNKDQERKKKAKAEAEEAAAEEAALAAPKSNHIIDVQI